MVANKELRVGNIVLRSSSWKEYKIARIDTNYCSCKLGLAYWNFPYDELEGVPLTKEQLLNYGFIELEDAYEKGDFMLTWEPSYNGLNKGWILFGLAGIMNGLRFVHELQNLFFAVTGNELLDNG